MNLLEKLDFLKAQKGDTNASLARNAGIPVTTIYGLYQKGYSNMQLSTLEALCNYFDVTLDFLAKDGKEDDPAKISGYDVNESELIGIYRDLNDIGQQALMGTARGLYVNPDMKKDAGSNTETA